MEAMDQTCFSSTVQLGEECASELPVRGCATSGTDTGPYLLNVGPGQVPLSTAASSCAGFYSTVCDMFGGIAGSSQDCSWYCEFMNTAVNASLASGCVSDTECFIFDNHLDFRPRPGSLCVSQARYSLFSSCMIPDSYQEKFMANVNQFLAGSEKPCTVNAVEQLYVSSIGPGPDSLTGFACYETSDCDFACFASGFQVLRQDRTVEVVSRYLGSCDCSVTGYFKGKILFSHESPEGTPTQIVAQNGFGDVNLTLVPYRSLNEFQTVIISSKVGRCEYVMTIDQGSMLGLPVDEPKTSSETSALVSSNMRPNMRGSSGTDAKHGGSPSWVTRTTSATLRIHRC